MKSLQQLFVEFQIDAANENDVVNWACEIISSNSEWANNKLLIQIAGLRPEVSDDENEIGKLFNKFFLQQFPNFKIQTSENESFVKQALKQVCLDFLAGQTKAGRLCRMVSSIETALDYPGWLGDLYNNCDGVNDLAKEESEPFLTKEVKKVCANL